MSDKYTDDQLAEWIQSDPDAITQIRQQLNAAYTQEEFDAAVRHRARGLAEKDRFDRHCADVVEDPEQYAEAVKLDAKWAELYPNVSERDRFSAVGETIRRGYGADLDQAQAIAAEQRHRRRAQEQAGEDEQAHKPTAADIAIAESEAEHESHVAEGIAATVRGRGPRVLAPRTDEQKLRDERLALERRRRAAGW